MERALSLNCWSDVPNLPGRGRYRGIVGFRRLSIRFHSLVCHGRLVGLGCYGILRGSNGIGVGGHEPVRKRGWRRVDHGFRAV